MTRCDQGVVWRAFARSSWRSATWSCKRQEIPANIFDANGKIGYRCKMPYRNKDVAMNLTPMEWTIAIAWAATWLACVAVYVR